MTPYFTYGISQDEQKTQNNGANNIDLISSLVLPKENRKNNVCQNNFGFQSNLLSLWCSDAVGSATGRASGL